ncbi:ROK family transcriptional regulator [Streptomyces himastatinicus]|uniref:ROK family transcriptional regulator n=1 Tax=Streptomyces himastatinicus TaxID=998084 RepID=UPI0001B509AF|nr:ROK family protein [Streptomyces himastatinicus]
MHKGDGYEADPVLLPSVPVGLRKVLDLVVSGEATSRAEIARRSGLVRTTVGKQVDHLVARGILEELESSESVRGRPPRVLTLSPRAGTVAVADVDTLASQVAIADLTGRVLAQETVGVRIATGPETVLETVTERLMALLAQCGRDSGRVRAVVMGLPAPVDFQRGCTVRPTGMPGWGGYPVADELRKRFRCPALVDNDANLMALGEAGQEQDGTPLVCIKISAGVGAGIVTAEGELYRGADGAAGDIGHIRAVGGGGDVLCSCGNDGCLSALASRPAVLRSLGIPESTDEDPLHGVRVLAERVADNEPNAVRALRQAGTDVGEIAAMLVSMFNPRTLVVGGPLSELRDDLLSGVRAVVYQRGLALATSKMTITTPRLGESAGIHGGIALATREVFSAQGVARMMVGEP